MSSTSNRVRSQLGHPVIDADGHVLEFMPAVLPHLREALGPALFARYVERPSPLTHIMTADPATRLETRAPQSAWWGTPAARTRDLATAAVPALLYERMDEIGIDFSVLYPTKGMGIAAIADDELRCGVCRGFNEFYAASHGSFADRMTMAGVVPMHTPQEAIAELEHCKALGLKVVGLPDGVRRPIPKPQAEAASPFLIPGQSCWFDSFGIDSAHDYDPVWAKAWELGFAITSHGGLGDIPPFWFTSVSNYSFNHIGGFASRMHTLCKSLFMAGVTRRFPRLGFAFLECGVGWASILLADLVEHWEKRNAGAIDALDPANVDWQALEAYVREYGSELLAGCGDFDMATALRALPATGVPPAERDEWRLLGVDSAEELAASFSPNLYFGCEADDRTLAFAFSPANPFGTRLRPVFSSDLSHWDVPDMAGVLDEAHQGVEEGWLSEREFAEFVFQNPARLLLGQNPDFFAGTAVEGATRELADAARRQRDAA
jgi:predicted TIM-barrel fold metal-dependent hydrolase